VGHTRYYTQELTPAPEKIAVFLANSVKTTSPKALEGLKKMELGGFFILL
jgi:hypothetical protein